MIYAITETFISIRDFMGSGKRALVNSIVGILMWGLIFERIYYLSHGHNVFLDSLFPNGIQELIKLHGTHYKLEKSFSRSKIFYKQEYDTYKNLHCACSTIWFVGNSDRND